MGKSLAALAGGDDRPERMNRQLAKEARPIRNDVRLTAMKIEGAMALAAHAMQKVSELDAVRRQLAANDEVLNQVCAEFEIEAVNQAKKLQRGLFDDFGLSG